MFEFIKENVVASEDFQDVSQVHVQAAVDFSGFSWEVYWPMTVDFSVSISVRIYFELRVFIK